MSGSRDKLLRNSPQEWPISLSCPPNALCFWARLIWDTGTKRDHRPTAPLSVSFQPQSLRQKEGRLRVEVQALRATLWHIRNSFLLHCAQGQSQIGSKEVKGAGCCVGLACGTFGQVPKPLCTQRCWGLSCYDTVRIQWESKRKLIPASGI